MEEEKAITEDNQSEEIDNSVKTKSKASSKKDQDIAFLEKDVNELLGDDHNRSFKEKLVQKILNLKCYQPYLDIDRVESEINSFRVDTNVVLEVEGDIEIYTFLMETIKGYKERLFFLYNRAEKEYNLIENTYNHLFRMWVGKFSRLSSEKRREGEAEFILDFMFIEREKRRMIYNLVKNSLDQMTDLQSLCSRKVSVIQEVHKVIGNMTMDNPSKMSSEINAHRKSMSEKVKEFKEKNKEATGWGAIPTKKDLE